MHAVSRWECVELACSLVEAMAWSSWIELLLSEDAMCKMRVSIQWSSGMAIRTLRRHFVFFCWRAETQKAFASSAKREIQLSS